MDPTMNSNRRALCRWSVLAAAAIGAGAWLGLAAGPAVAAPVTLNVVDVAGNLALTQDAIEAYQKKHPDLVAKVTFTKAPAPEPPGKLKAMKADGRSDTD